MLVIFILQVLLQVTWETLYKPMETGSVLNAYVLINSAKHDTCGTDLDFH